MPSILIIMKRKRKRIMSSLVKKHKSVIEAYLLIIIGTGILAASIQFFYDPIGLVTGGFTGLAIVIKSLTSSLVNEGIPLWLTNIGLNIPVFILAYIFMGRKYVGRTLFASAMLSVWLYVIPLYDVPKGDLLLAAIFGALFSGGGIGIVLKGHATTGGTDMVASLIQLKLRHYSVAKIMQVLDGTIVLVGLFKFGLISTLYAIIAIYVTTKVTDLILEGFNISKAAYIITDQHEEVAQKIMTELDRGVTGIEAKGMYTNEDKCMLYCVVSRKEIVDVKSLVAEIDPRAFVIVSDVREVLGEGFQEYKNQF